MGGVRPPFLGSLPLRLLIIHTDHRSRDPMHDFLLAFAVTDPDGRNTGIIGMNTIFIRLPFPVSLW
jgi:hypothetical protein